MERAIKIGKANGLTVTSLKRDWGPRSDHYLGQTNSYAADLSNGRNPTPEMDKTAREIANALGFPNYRGGYILNAKCESARMRVQRIWRADDHFDHVHVGARRT